ncbi:MAG: type II secretion system F family protein [Patescibacteria group bacterium]
MIFDYKAKDASGTTVQGVVEAPSMKVAADLLKDRHLVILSLMERRKPIVFGSLTGLINRVPKRDLVIFSRQLSVMVSSTVPIVRALRTLVLQTQNVPFKVIISDIADEVEGGARLSASLGKYPTVFDPFYIYLVRAGETTGKLDETLNYLADQKEKDYDLTNRIRGAMIYPAFIVAGLTVVGTIMMIFVIPKLVDVLADSGAELPLSTRILIGSSSFLQAWWWLLALGILAVIGGVVMYRQTPSGQRVFDWTRIHLPIFGQIFQKVALTRFARTLSNLLKSGIPLGRSLELVSDIVGNVIYRDLIHATIAEVEAGHSIVTVFSKSSDMPIMVSQMMSVGEQTGKLDQILQSLADFYARELDNSVRNLVTLIEPLIMVVLGIAVGILVAGILLPMYNLSTTL